MIFGCADVGEEVPIINAAPLPLGQSAPRVGSQQKKHRFGLLAAQPGGQREGVGFPLAPSLRYPRGLIGFERGVVMKPDTDQIDAAVLALLLLGLHDDARVWKTFDWDAMDRLHAKGFISDPVGKAKSVVLTDEGRREAERLFQMMFAAR